MARRQGRQSESRRDAYQRQTTYRNAYIDGNTVRHTSVIPNLEPEPSKELIDGNKPESRPMSFGYAFFLVAMMIIAGVSLIEYVLMQYQVTNNIKQIAQLESQLISLTQTNDETYDKIVNSVDLDEVKKIAMGQMGMIYAEEGQIITYTSTERDYVRQYEDIPQ